MNAGKERAFPKDSPDISVRIGPLELRSPFMPASGTFGYGREYRGLVDYRALGAIVVKGLSLEPCPGNPPPRTVETPCGMLNAVGLQNPGVDYFLRNHLPWLRDLEIPVIVNVWGKTIQEYAALARRLHDSGVAALELNVSCPNVKAGGVHFGTDPRALRQVVRAAAEQTDLPLIPKLPPLLHETAGMVQAAAEAGATAITLVNSVPAMKVDVARRRPALFSVTGGLSGPAIHAIAVRLVWQAARASPIPIIAAGGVATAEDAIEFFIVGASAVQIGTSIFTSPRIFGDLRERLLKYLLESNFSSLTQVVGSLVEKPEA